MCPEHLSHKDEKRDKRGGDDDEDGADGVTRRCDNEGGMRRRRR
jgi:hypothetical protein